MIQINPPKQVLSVSVTVVNKDSEILLFKGQNNGWNIPTGLVQENESLRVAAIREVKDKTGILIKLIRFCGIFQNVNAGICHMIFIGTVIGGQIVFDNENSLDAGFFPIQTSMRLIAWKIYKHRILYSLDDTKHPFLIDF